jgi:hypothetical protein
MPDPTENLLKEVNASVRKRRNSANSNDFVIDANTQTALSEIKTKFKERGAICDSEGFYQHEGECWNDAIQMMFLFSDGLKEVVQEKLANNEIDINFIPRENISLIINAYNRYKEDTTSIFAASNKYAHLIPPALTDKQIIESLLFYLEFLKHRFVRHYTMESNRREEECKTIRNPIKILHTKGKNAQMAAIFAIPSRNEDGKQSLKKYKADYNSHGAFGYQLRYLTVILLLSFFYNERVGYAYNMAFSDIFYKYIDGSLYILSILLKTSDHALCLYTCGGHDFFYEDNDGPFLFPWRDILFKSNISGTSISNILFSMLIIDSRYNISDYYPIIKTVDNKYFTYYDSILYTFPPNIFDSKPPEGFTKYSFDKISFSFNYDDNKYLNFIERTNSMIPLFKVGFDNSSISNKSFTFKRNARLNKEYIRKERAKQGGLPLNSPFLNWENESSKDHIRWRNPNIKQTTFVNPYLVSQKTDEELRKELRNRGIIPPENISHNLLINALIKAPELTNRKKASIKRALNFGLPANSPMIDWEQDTSEDGKVYWEDQKTYTRTYTDPYLVLQKTDEELRRELKDRGIIPANDDSHNVLVYKLLHSSPLSPKKRASIKKVLNLGLPLNSRIRDWEESPYNDGKVGWYNPDMGKFMYTDPYLVSQKTDEELIKDLRDHGITVSDEKLRNSPNKIDLHDYLVDQLIYEVLGSEPPQAAGRRRSKTMRRQKKGRYTRRIA